MSRITRFLRSSLYLYTSRISVTAVFMSYPEAILYSIRHSARRSGRKQASMGTLGPGAVLQSLYAAILEKMPTGLSSIACASC